MLLPMTAGGLVQQPAKCSVNEDLELESVEAHVCPLKHEAHNRGSGDLMGAVIHRNDRLPHLNGGGGGN